ncbi:hypothetical protein [Kineosporia sp. NBRC 101731]|uniref:hypothetical protein n=1 Tax=Kineosporia sp. NBRC 101731 TaxID=3032199 RepID=UPI0025537335|nr:hypothetical protein [Kineosporia sp. NBRC 101731]
MVERSEHRPADAPTASVVSPNLVIRLGLTHVLEHDGGFRVVQSAASIPLLKDGIEADVTVMDLSAYHVRIDDVLKGPVFGRGHGLALCSPESVPELGLALQRGLLGLVARDTGADGLLQAMTSVMAGNLHIDAALLRPFFEQLTRPRPVPKQLSTLEADLLRLIARDLTRRSTREGI